MRHPFLRTLAGASAVATDPNFENVTLLLHGDGTNGGQNNTFADGSTNNFSITRNGNTTQGTFSPYGDNWSNYFDGTGDDLSLTGQSLAATDWTVECWVYFQSFANNAPHVWNFGTDISNRYNVWRNNTTGTFSFARVNSGSYDIKNGTTVPVVGRWYHIAVVRVNSTGVQTLYVDGVAEVTNTGSISTGTTWTLGFVPGGGTADRMLGYISNFRVVTSAVYTANFTPPTAPLTAITNTSLLTCSTNRFRDVSSNNRTITRNGDVSVQRFSPFSPTAAYAAGTIGGSGYFDGTGDYLSASSNAAFSFGTGNFTIECFFYPTSTDSTQYVYLLDSTGGITFGFEPVSSVASFVLGRRATAVDLSATYTIVPFQWLHLVAVRSGTTASLYINGTRVATGTNSQNYTVSGPVNVGAIATAGTYETNGYISNLRVVKGTAVYDPTQSTLTVPTSPLTAITNTSLLLNFTNAAILDNAMMAVPETVGNAQIDTTTKKYGTGSLEFDGTGDWLLIPDSPDQRLGTGNLTIECWLYLSATGTARGIVGKGTSTTGWLLSTNTSNAVVFTYGTSTITSTGTLSGTTWYHIAVVREGTGTNQTKIYIGGTNDGTGTVSTDFTQTNAAYVGANRTGGDPMNGYIDDLRITKGVARYTANFTPPTAALPDL